LIYDSVESAKEYEPKYKLVRNELHTKVEKFRKQMKERKNRANKIRGVKKTKAGDDQFCSAFNYNFRGNFVSSL
jgi:small subunit ribosomal protein S24e